MASERPPPQQGGEEQQENKMENIEEMGQDNDPVPLDLSKIESCFLDFLSSLFPPADPSHAAPAPPGALRINSLNDVSRVSRVLFTLLSVYRNALTGSFINQRSIYYSNVPLFARQPRADRAIAAVGKITQTSRIGMQVLASGKGFCQGPIDYTLMVDGELTSFSCLTSSLVHPRSSQIRHINVANTVKYILIVEKDTIYHELSESDYAASNSCIIITGRGFPDFATRQFLARIVEARPELAEPGRIMGLFDGDVYGLEIYLCYKYGDMRSSSSSSSSSSSLRPPCFPSLVHVGVSLRDFSDDQLQRLGQRMDDREKRRIDTLTQRIQRHPDACGDEKALFELDEFRVRCGGGWRVEVEAVKRRDDADNHTLKHIVENIVQTNMERRAAAARAGAPAT